MGRILDDTDRAIVNGLQGGFPLTETPFADAAAKFGIGEDELIARISGLADDKLLSRFGPMYNAERLGGDHPDGDLGRLSSAHRHPFRTA